MKKECSECRFLCREGYEDYYYVCALFGEDIPDWATLNGDCCLLKCQEIKKLIRLQNDFLIVGTGECDPETFYPKWTEEDEKHNEIAKKNYDDYIEILKERCEERKYKAIVDDLIDEEKRNLVRQTN